MTAEGGGRRVPPLSLRKVIFLGLALGGLWTAWGLTMHYVEVQADPLAASWCDVDETFNCTEVARSAWGAWRLPLVSHPVPTALPAVGFFVALGILALSLGPKAATRRRVGAVILGLSAVASAVSVALLGVQVFILGVFCLQCLILDALVFAVTAAAWVSYRGDGGRLGGLASFSRGALVVALVVGGAATAVGYLEVRDELRRGERVVARIEGDGAAAKGDDRDREERERQRLRDRVRRLLSDWRQQPRHEIAPGPADGVAGAYLAGVTVVEFIDYQCPSCKRAAGTMDRLMRRYGDKVAFRVLNYPLNSACNPALSSGAHPLSCDLARAALCAGRQDAFWPMHRAIFAEQERLDSESAGRIARRIGLDMDEFGRCLADPATASALSKQVRQGLVIPLRGTPTVLVDGRLVSNPAGTFVEAAIRAALRERGIEDLPPDPTGVLDP